LFVSSTFSDCERDLRSIPFGQLLTKISNTTLNERSVVIVTAVLIFSMIMDMELSNLADIFQERISSPIGIFTLLYAIQMHHNVGGAND
jgi:hypothetical protein